MIQHSRRIPALILLLAGGAAGAYLKVAGKPAQQAAAVAAAQTGLSQNEIDRQVAAGQAGPAVLFAFAERQRQERQFSLAADAYAKVLAKEPFNREARLHRASCLAMANRTDDLLSFLSDLLYSDAKLVVDIIDRPECQQNMKDPRFAALAKEARSQAMD